MKKISVIVYESDAERLAAAERILHMKEEWLMRIKNINPQVAL